MNALNVMTAARNRWFHLGVAAIGIILLGSAVALSLVMSARVTLPRPGRETTSALSAAQQRYEDFKLAQVARLELSGHPNGALSAARQRYENFKLQQYEMKGA